MGALQRGDLPPEMKTEPPGRRSRQLAATLSESEAPVVNTIVDQQPALCWREALGSNVLDVDDNRYIDLTAGFGAAGVGHRHPKVVAALRRQSELLIHGLGDVQAHPERVRLSARLRELAPMADAQVYYAASGADAVEIALKTAVLASGKTGVLAFRPSYHGLTLGALSVSSRAEFREPFRSILRPGVHRLPYGCPESDLERTLDRHADIGAVIFEPIAGREGVLVPPEGWIEMLLRSCGSRGILLIADEILTGFGRTGTLFAVSGADGAVNGAQVDLVCCGKALAGGLPIGAVLGRRSVLKAWDHAGEALHTCTFLANPLSCAAALAVLEVLEDEELPQRARRLGDSVGQRLGEWGRFEVVVETRGRGLLWGIELASSAQASAIVATALGKGLLLLSSGSAGTVLQISPALTIAEDQLTRSLDILESVLAEVAP